MDIDELRRIAAKEEISLNYAAKDEMISRMLLILQNNNALILKGGTAINRVYINNKRFSEDIDFDLIFKGTVKEAITKTKEIVDALHEFSVAKPRIMKNTIRYDVFYINPLNHKDKIRIEFNVVKKALNYSKKIVNFGFVQYNSSLHNVYDAKELIKHKTECIMNRIEGKDYFDLYYLLHENNLKIKLDSNIIDKINFAQNNKKTIANSLNHYIPRKERPDWDLFFSELKKIVLSLIK